MGRRARIVRIPGLPGRGLSSALTVTGRAVLLRLPEQTFKIAFRTVLTLLGVRLLWSAVQGLT